MSLVVLGLSHHTAPLPLLEAVSDDAARADLAARIVARENASEAIVVSTCNRTEIYAEAHTFHGAVTDITESLTEVCRVGRDDLREHLYVHYEDRAIAHAFTVACGLDSMAVGEAQILGQMRSALRAGQKAGHAGLPQRPLPAGAAGRQARPHRDRHRLRQRLPRRGRTRPRAGGSGRWRGCGSSWSAPAA